MASAAFAQSALRRKTRATSVGLYRSVTKKAAAAIVETTGEPMHMEFVAGWAEHPKLAEAFALRMWPAWAEACAAVGERVPILFTAHSVPCRTIMSGTVSSASSPSARPGQAPAADGIQNYGERQTPDPYPVECKQTAAAIARCLGAVWS